MYSKLFCGYVLICHYVHLALIVVELHSYFFLCCLWLLVLVYLCLHFRTHLVGVYSPPIISLVYFLCSTCFLTSSLMSSQISEYLILLSLVTMTPDYRCILIVLLLLMTVTSNYWWLIIVRYNGFQLYQYMYHFLTRLVHYTMILVSYCHTQCCAFAWRVYIKYSVYVVNILFIHVSKTEIWPILHWILNLKTYGIGHIVLFWTWFQIYQLTIGINKKIMAYIRSPLFHSLTMPAGVSFYILPYFQGKNQLYWSHDILEFFDL